MWSIGFGFEKIGQIAHRFPGFFSVLLVVVTLASAFQVTKVRFDGDVTAVLPAESQAYRDYFNNKERFRDFSRDITILVESPRLATASGLEDLRFLQLELAVSEGVENVTSLFSLPLPDPQTGALGQFFPQQIADDEEAKALLARLLSVYPQAGSLVSPQKGLAVLQVTLAGQPGDNAMDAYPQYLMAKKAAETAAPQDFKLRITGLTPIGATIVEGLVSDQIRLTIIGLFLGGGIAYLVFRNVVAASIAALPTGLTSLWTLGLFGLFDIPINYLTTVLPTLALIIAFEDSIMLTFQWQSANAKGGDANDNLSNTLRDVGPASALTSITTLLAFVAFIFVSGTALREFAWIGAASIAIAFLAVMITVPVMAHWAMHFGLIRGGQVRQPAFGALGRRVNQAMMARPLTIAVGAILAVLVMGIAHFQIKPEYRITDYLPHTSQVREAEMLSNEVFGGRSMLLVSVPKAQSGPSLSPPNRARLGEVERVIGKLFAAEKISSANRLTATLASPAAIDRLAGELDAASQGDRASQQSRSGDAMLVTVRIPSSQSIGQTLDEIARLKAGIGALPYGGDVIITGFDVLMAEEFTGLIDQLRASLIIEIVLGVAIIGFAARSVSLAIAATTPNLLPILFVEVVIWMRGGAVNMSEVIALTIGFGIAVGNAVHIINFFVAERNRGASVDDAVSKAVDEAGPAVAASMIIICIASLVTQLSVLPMVPVLGMLIISTLLVALAANLVILPANILVLNRYVLPRIARQPAKRERQQENPD